VGLSVSIRILTGDCLEVLRSLPGASVNCVVTSPPYYGLRDYGCEGQIGLEETPEAYVAKMVGVFREVRRVLADDGTCWINIGDSYAGHNLPGFRAGNEVKNGGVSNKNGVGYVAGCKPKDLIGIPWMLAFALRADGWYLRQDIIWHKPNPMPESVRDRCTKAHEYVFLLSKSPRYFYDADAIAEESEPFSVAHGKKYGDMPSISPKGNPDRNDNGGRGKHCGVAPGRETRNKRSVWTITTQPFSEAHFATMAPELAETCIKAGTSEKGCCPHCGSQWARQVERIDQGYDGSEYGKRVIEGSGLVKNGQAQARKSTLGSSNGKLTGKTQTLGWAASCSCPEHKPVPATILDPFGGAGTTALCADRLGRNALLIELNPAYVEIARKRLTNDAGLFAEVAA
jgi:DNA modification methylase